MEDGDLGFRDFNEGHVKFDEDVDALAGELGQHDFLGDGHGKEEGREEEPEEPLPEWACAYCGVHNPACVVKCIKTGKWFCNGRQQGCSASCAVYHLVRSKVRQMPDQCIIFVSYSSVPFDSMIVFPPSLCPE